MWVIHLSKRFLQSQVFRYFVSAGTATMVDLSAFFVTYNYVLHKQDVHVGAFEIAGPSLSLLVSSSFGLATNFLITKYFVFTESNIKGHVQFFRYFLVAMLVLLANYGVMNVLIHLLHFYPTIARAVSAVCVGVLSFTIHRVFSFQIKDGE